MLKKLLVAVVLISFSIQSQTFVKGSMNPINKKLTWVAMYQLTGTKQVFIKNTTILNGKFYIELPQNTKRGMYRIKYQMDNSSFVDFIYNNESVELKFNPNNPFETLEFLTSEENKTYHKYVKESEFLTRELDSLQLTYFRLKDPNKRNNTNNLYKISLNNFRNFQREFEKNTQGKLSNHFIKASNKYYAPNIIQTQQEYLNSEKLHFFDFINFSDTALINSAFISEKVINYVFYFNVSDDKEVQNKLYKNAVNKVLNEIGGNMQLKSELLITLLYTFSQVENATLIDYLFTNFYNKLPETYKNNTDVKNILAKVKLAVGKKAPDFTWVENGKNKKLYELNNADKYILVFWSTGCSHCLYEIPQFYEFTKDKSNVHVIAFAMENDNVDFKKYTAKYVKWTNILGLKKWGNTIAREYQIKSTPTYFILDKDKRIIAKPEHFEDLKAYFEN